MIFDSTASVGEGEAVYVAASATQVGSERLEVVWSEAFRTTADAKQFTPDELRHSGLRLYVAHSRSCEVHVPGDHPVHGCGVDTRQPADPVSREP